jgi:predicted tellurium resistance membrane protein TerC
VAKLLARYRWIGWLGLAIIVYVAISMLVDGAEDLMKLDFRALLGAAAPAAG